MCLDAGVNLSTPPTSTPTGCRRRSSARRCAGRRDRRAARHQGPHADGRRAQRRRPLPPPHHPRRARRACGGWAPTTSTSTRCTSGTARPRSRRRCDALDHLVQLGQGPLHRLLELRRLAADEGARRSPSGAATSASSSSRSTTRCRRATPSTSSCRVGLDQGVGILVWSPLAGGLLSGKYRRGQSTRPEGSRHLTRLGRAAGARRGPALRHRRRARRDRRGARRLGRAGRAGVAARRARASPR